MLHRLLVGSLIDLTNRAGRAKSGGEGVNESHHAKRDLDDVAVLQNMIGSYRIGINDCSVSAAQVMDDPPGWGVFDFGVMAAASFVGHDDLVRRCPTNDQLTVRVEPKNIIPTASLPNDQVS